MSAPRTVHPGLAAWAALRASGAAAGALVTMVRADAGTSKTLGMHLAVADDGRTFGTVTVGGCADGRALEVARRVIGSGRPERITLPLSEADALALGLGCAGEVDLYVERVSLATADPAARALDAAAALADAGEPVALATALEGGGERQLLRADEAPPTGVHERDGATWFVEHLAPARTVMIVGATEIAAALCTLARPLGWRTILLDARDEVLAEPRFGDATERIAAMPAEVVAPRMRGPHAPAVVIVAHDYRVELPVLRAALAGDSPYVGMLGSRARGATIRAMLADDGLAADRVARLRSPIGLAIGAEGPAEIAVSIVAELVAAWRGVAARP